MCMCIFNCLRYCQAQLVQAPIYPYLRPTAKHPPLLTEMQLPPNYSPCPSLWLFAAQSPPSDHRRMEKIVSFPSWKPFPLYLAWSFGGTGRVHPMASGYTTFPAVSAQAHLALLPFPRLSYTSPWVGNAHSPSKGCLYVRDSDFLIPESQTDPSVSFSLIAL